MSVFLPCDEVNNETSYTPLVTILLGQEAVWIHVMIIIALPRKTETGSQATLTKPTDSTVKTNAILKQ